MTSMQTSRSDWLKVAVVTVGIAAAFSAVLVYAMAVFPTADPPGVRPGLFGWLVQWLGLTPLFTLLFAAGIWRMTGSTTAIVSPWGALAILAATVILCSASIVAVTQLHVPVVVASVGALIASAAVAALVWRLDRRRPSNGPPDGSASG